MMPETVRHESVVGIVCGPVVGRFALFSWLVPQPRCVASFSSGATLVRHTLGSALIECIALALEPCHRCRIGVAGPNVQLLTVLAGLVGVEQAEVLIEAFVDRRCGSPTATGREHEKAERETRSGSKPRLLPRSHIHVQANTATLCLRSAPNAGSEPSGTVALAQRLAFRPVAIYEQASTLVYSLCRGASDIFARAVPQDRRLLTIFYACSWPGWQRPRHSAPKTS